MGKRGPSPKWAVDRNREPVIGLILRSDGRYIAHDDRCATFGRDRDDAIRRFRQWQARHRNERIHIPERNPIGRNVNFLPHIEPIETEKDPPQNLTLFHSVPSPEFWDTVRQVISINPKLAAQKTGIEQLAYLTDLKPPAPSKSLKEIGETYISEKKKLTGKEAANSLTWWNEFIKITGAKTIADLTHDAVKKYREKIKADQLIPFERAGKIAPKSNSYTRSRFGKIAAVINYALAEINLSQSDRQTLGLKSLLKKPPKPTSKPIDIDKDELTALLAKADDFDTALILTGLNCCFNPIDLARLKWDMIDMKNGVLRFDRHKSEHLAGSAVVRVAVLWKRTMNALEKIRKDNELVFITREGPMEKQTPNHRFKKLLKKAGITRKLTFTNLRDSAQTRAAELGVPMQTYQCLAGHKLPGVDDDYIRRNPNFVRQACEAIERYYFGKVNN